MNTRDNNWLDEHTRCNLSEHPNYTRGTRAAGSWYQLHNGGIGRWEAVHGEIVCRINQALGNLPPLMDSKEAELVRARVNWLKDTD